MVIFKGKRLNPEWTLDEIPDTLYGLSEKGWTDMGLFGYWMDKLFLPNIPPVRPVLLLLDGHSSHYEPDTIDLAANQGVIVLCLPPHTTHVSQPLAVSFFRPLKFIGQMPAISICKKLDMLSPSTSFLHYSPRHGIKQLSLKL